ncbi:HAD family hydrolase [Demequina flava]|uniref:HAD family hydrolase n=1 Tax=Demequina flava TaxID=1095025 RepID=UPI000783587B|nr:HAD family hydrolase [Demequina flava]
MPFSPAHSRAIFLDVDGTYADHGVVPKAHEDAVRAVRANGHAVLLCTGRPVSAISPHLLAAGFDGIVSGAGARVELGDDVLVDVRFPADIARRTVEVLDHHGAVYALESPEAMYAGPEVDLLLDSKTPGPEVPPERRDAFAIFRKALEITHARADKSYSKVFVFDSGAPMRQVLDEIGPEVSAVAGSNEALGERTGEIHLAHITKAVGMQAALEGLGLPADASVAAGDGPNDREMLASAGTAIVVEGALPDLMAMADLVAGPPSTHGLVSAFTTLGLI